MHPDGYIELRDRAKDIVISGGENISTIEVEHALLVAPGGRRRRGDRRPGREVGRAAEGVRRAREGVEATEAELIEHVKAHIAPYKAPREVEFVPQLPKTSTGKVRKNELRDAEWGDAKSRIKG